MQNEANFAEKKVKILILHYFFKFECLNMHDIADYDSTNCSRPLDHQQLPVLRAKLFKMRPILQKKGENLDFRLFFRV